MGKELKRASIGVIKNGIVTRPEEKMTIAMKTLSLLVVHWYVKSRNGPCTSTCVSRGVRDREVARPPELDSPTDRRWGMSHARGVRRNQAALRAPGRANTRVALRTDLSLISA